MKPLALAVALFAAVAFAGERIYLGRILSAAGASTTNASTLFPFSIPPGSKLTFYCSVATNVLTDALRVNALYDGGSAACETGTCAQPYGVPFAAATLYPTSVGSDRTTRITTVSADGGSGPYVPTALVAIQPTVNAGGFCDFWQRAGTE